MNNLPYQDAEERAIQAIKDNRASLELWGHEDNREMTFEFTYPRYSNNIDSLIVGLGDVRASDGIRITYDFDRDGYVIQQPTQLSWNVDEVVDQKWKEVAFIESWALEEEQKANEPN